VYAAISKLLNYESFKVELGKSPLLTDIAGEVAVGIPIIELIISGLLGFQATKMLGLYSSFSLMVLFTGYLIAIIQFSFFVPCTCGGLLEKLDWNKHIIFNCLFIVLAAIAVIIFPRKYKIY
jgi:hypothetical protein